MLRNILIDLSATSKGDDIALEALGHLDDLEELFRLQNELIDIQNEALDFAHKAMEDIKQKLELANAETKTEN